MITVLIIEDDPWMAQRLGSILAREGFLANYVTNGYEAMAHIDKKSPDVLLLDMLITGGTGLTLLHELQSYEDTAKIPVILCTNLAAGLSLVSVAPYGVRRLLDKTTMTPEDVIVAVRAVL